MPRRDHADTGGGPWRANTTLQYLGGGRYRRHWTLPAMLPNSCMRLTLDLGNGVPRVLQVKL